MKNVLLALALVAPAAAECPNACSGHGTCGAFDECHCFPNWQEADCSGKTCPFALAHVDSPKGDLDGSADALSGRTTTVIEGNTVYPYGTTEQYPLMVDYVDDGCQLCDARGVLFGLLRPAHRRDRGGRRRGLRRGYAGE